MSSGIFNDVIQVTKSYGVRQKANTHHEKREKDKGKFPKKEFKRSVKIFYKSVELWIKMAPTQTRRRYDAVMTYWTACIKERTKIPSVLFTTLRL